MWWIRMKKIIIVSLSCIYLVASGCSGVNQRKIHHEENDRISKEIKEPIVTVLNDSMYRVEYCRLINYDESKDECKRKAIVICLNKAVEKATGVNVWAEMVTSERESEASSSIFMYKTIEMCSSAMIMDYSLVSCEVSEDLLRVVVDVEIADIVGQEDEDYRIDLYMDNTGHVYHDGDPIVFTITCNQDSDIYLFDVDENRLSLLNDDRYANRLCRKGERFEIPTAEERRLGNFYQATLPVSEEEMHCELKLLAIKKEADINPSQLFNTVFRRQLNNFLVNVPRSMYKFKNIGYTVKRK